jgi:hypothetical protein
MNEQEMEAMGEAIKSMAQVAKHELTEVQARHDEKCQIMRYLRSWADKVADEYPDNCKVNPVSLLREAARYIGAEEYKK